MNIIEAIYPLGAYFRNIDGQNNGQVANYQTKDNAIDAVIFRLDDGTYTTVELGYLPHAQLEADAEMNAAYNRGINDYATGYARAADLADLHDLALPLAEKLDRTRGQLPDNSSIALRILAHAYRKGISAAAGTR